MDVVQEAENVIESLRKDRFGKPDIATSQLRKFLSAVNVMNNKVLVSKVEANGEKVVLPDAMVAEIKYLKVKAIYQAGRDPKAREFVEKAKLGQWIDSIGNSREKYEEFSRYMEALVAWHKFKGGRD